MLRDLCLGGISDNRGLHVAATLVGENARDHQACRVSPDVIEVKEVVGRKFAALLASDRHQLAAMRAAISAGIKDLACFWQRYVRHEN